jgi:hypothetical protein
MLTGAIPALRRTLSVPSIGSRSRSNGGRTWCARSTANPSSLLDLVWMLDTICLRALFTRCGVEQVKYNVEVTGTGTSTLYFQPQEYLVREAGIGIGVGLGFPA